MQRLARFNRLLSNIRDTKGSLNSREKAAEDLFVKERDLEHLKDLKLKAKTAQSAPTSTTTPKSDLNPLLAGTLSARPVMNTRESAAEEKYFYEQDKAKMKNLKK